MTELQAVSSRRLLVPAQRAKALWRGVDASGPRRIRLFDVSIDDTTVANASTDWLNAALRKRKLRAVFLNAHVVNEMASRPGYRAVVATADRVYADGSGVAVAAKLAGHPLMDNVNGTDVFPKLAKDASAAGVKIFLLGAAPGVAAAAVQRMAGFGIGDAIVGSHHGYFKAGSAEEAAAISAVNASGADIVLVAMGVPLQDEWILTNAHRIEASVTVGVGGLFDFFAGRVTRAPHAMRVVGCEWMWRLALEPRRMAGRYLIGNAKFLALAMVEAARARWRDRRADVLGQQAPQVEVN